MGAEYLSYVKFIATFAPTFYGDIIFILGSVYDYGCHSLYPFLNILVFRENLLKFNCSYFEKAQAPLCNGLGQKILL